MKTLKRVGWISLWILQVLAALAFVVIGVAKFADPGWSRNFARWGYPAGFYMMIGVLELAGGVCLLVPRIAAYAAAFLGAIMVGALATHVVHNETARLVGPLMYLVVLAIVALGRWRSAVRPPVIRGRTTPVQPV
jgi:putative oxidoreductase